jgi:flagellar basal body-associated protein FliL
MSNDPQQSQQEPASDRPLYEFVSTSYGPVPYGDMPPVPHYAQVPPKKSHRRMWITLGIVGIVLVLFVCGGCVTASFLSFRYIQQNIGPALVTSQYYEAIKEQRYDLAYSYLDAHASIQGRHVSLTTFTHMAQTADTTRGKVMQYTPASFTTTGSTANTATVIGQVTRSKQTYPVSLQLKREGNNWKIIDANRI